MIIKYIKYNLRTPLIYLFMLDKKVGLYGYKNSITTMIQKTIIKS